MFTIATDVIYGIRKSNAPEAHIFNAALDALNREDADIDGARDGALRAGESDADTEGEGVFDAETDVDEKVNIKERQAGANDSEVRNIEH